MQIKRALQTKIVAATLGVLALTGSAYALGDNASRNNFEVAKTHLDDLSIEVDELTNDRTIEVMVAGVADGAIVHFLTNNVEAVSASTKQPAVYTAGTENENLPINILLPESDDTYTISAYQSIGYRDLTATGKAVSASITLDTVAPTGSILLVQDLPEYTNQSELTLNPVIKTDDQSALLHINGEGPPVDVPLSEKTIKISLWQGDNEISLSLLDSAGNISASLFKTNVSLNTISPVIKTGFSALLCKDADISTETVCLSAGQFSGPLYGTAYAPITGSVFGEISYITLNGNRLSIKPDGTINQRVALYVAPGDNTYDVEVGDVYGNVGYGTLSVSWGKEDDGEQDDLDEVGLEPTALCNDGTYSYSQHRSGTCSWHDGVAEWY